MERVAIDVPRAAFETWAAPRLRGVVGVGAPRVLVYVRRGGATVGVLDAASACCLAFEVEISAESEDLAFAIHHARGIGLEAPATLLAVRAMATLFGDHVVRKGARFVAAGVAARIGRDVFPERGARAPDASGLVWGTVRGHDDAWILIAQRGDSPAEPLASAVVAREGCALAEAADNAAFALDLEKARELLVLALERAPRHRELSRRLAEMDRALGIRLQGGGRVEAALATLRDSRGEGALDGALLLADLLLASGDRAGALAAYTRAGEAEPVGPLSALAWTAASQLADDAEDALSLLDRAVARAPTLPEPRWARLSLRLAQGRLDGARADAEHLEALAQGPRARHAVWLRAGTAFRKGGRDRESGPLFERALRYRPEDPLAVAGLGAALVALGKATRGVELMAQAIDLADAAGVPAWQTVVDLATTLGDTLGDRAAAVARVRAVPLHAREALAARALEARWRSELGDIAGASLAFALARDLVEARPDLSSEDRALAVRALLDGARLESEKKQDWAASQRHLQVAARVAPGDPAVRAALRETRSRVAGTVEVPTLTRMDIASIESAPTWTNQFPLADVGSASTREVELELDEEARVEALTHILQGDPTNDAVVDELSTRLLRLGRAHELYALLAARLDEASPERRAALLPRQREVLLRLETEARAAGRGDEAALYKEARESL